jgi:hypothetical protein
MISSKYFCRRNFMLRNLSIIVFTGFVLCLSGCSTPTPEQQVKQQLDKVHPLNDKERALGDANAKKFFERPWPVNTEKKTVDGTFIACRPSDSNNNGLVTCTGFKPDVNTSQLVEVKKYCGYKPELVGCNDEDTVK